MRGEYARGEHVHARALERPGRQQVFRIQGGTPGVWARLTFAASAFAADVFETVGMQERTAPQWTSAAQKHRSETEQVTKR